MTAAGPTFPPTRAAGLARVAQFVPMAGRDYAQGRNSDPGPDQPGAVSRLSPYLRYRLLTEQEVVAATLAHHGLDGAEKFTQEVLWRTYWKGWLELRPAVWSRYLAELAQQRAALTGSAALAAAETGTTGIEGFDDWARELVATGTLHNHARMWFASIWIFTLRLPWVLGADFFLRHLIDADPASNTLSWRWVAGLQTAGKAYFATADNIARHTGGRFAPSGLAREAAALSEPPVEAARPLPDPPAYVPGRPALLLVTHEDLHPESLGLANDNVRAAAVLADPALLWGDKARQFVSAAATDSAARVGAAFACGVDMVDGLDADRLAALAQAAGAQQIVTAQAATGPVATALAGLAPQLAGRGIPLAAVRRTWDANFWPCATKGFCPFKERIPATLRELALL